MNELQSCVFDCRSQRRCHEMSDEFALRDTFNNILFVNFLQIARYSENVIRTVIMLWRTNKRD